MPPVWTAAGHATHTHCPYESDTGELEGISMSISLNHTVQVCPIHSTEYRVSTADLHEQRTHCRDAKSIKKQLSMLNLPHDVLRTCTQ